MQNQIYIYVCPKSGLINKTTHLHCNVIIYKTPMPVYSLGMFVKGNEFLYWRVGRVNFRV